MHCHDVEARPMTIQTITRKLILGTAGHIDHGKTALVRTLTGLDTDRLPEEKRRGMTIDLGFAHWRCGDTDLGIVDVPGHERFIRNMLAGSAGIDLAMLVIAADDSVMPQTREHLEILELMGVQRGLVVVSKCDLVDDELVELAEMEIRELVADTFLSGAPIVRTSAQTGQGVDQLRDMLSEICNTMEAPTPGELFRLAVDRSFVMTGQGTVVTGSVTSGLIRVGQTVQWLPEDRPLRIRSLESHGRPVEQVQRGQRAAIGVVGAHHRQIVRGHELATPEYLRPSRVLTVQLRVLGSVTAELKHRMRLRLHIGTGSVVTTVNLISARRLVPGESALAQLFLAEPVSAVHGQPFVIRRLSPATMIGGGTVIHPVASRIHHRDVSAIEWARSMCAAGALDRAAAAVQYCGIQSWSRMDLCRDVGVDVPDAEKLIIRLRDQGVIVEICFGHDRIALLHTQIAADFEGAILDIIHRHHQDQPLDMAIERHLIHKRLHRHDNGPLTLAMIERMVQAGRLSVVGSGVAIAGFFPQLTVAQQQWYDGLREAYRSADLRPPTTADLLGVLGADQAQLRALRNLAVKRRHLVHLGGDVFLDLESEKKLRTQVAAALSATASLAVGQIRQVLDTSRKYAVPFCEYLDRIGVTQRRGDVRVCGGRASGALVDDPSGKTGA